MTKLLYSTLVASIVLAAATPAQAALVVDTGSPNSTVVGSYTLNSASWYAAQINLSTSSVTDVSTHILGGTAGETFTVALYADDLLTHLPSASAIYSATATFTSDGWNGVYGLNGWDVSAGQYWLAFEVQAGQDLGNGSVTGALLDTGATNPVIQTAFDISGGLNGYALTSPNPLSIGLQVAATPAVVPLPAALPLLLCGLGALGGLARKRKVAA